jgi:DNA-binding PadR family transcriptional regulator
MADDEGRDPATLLPLTPTVFHILLALADGAKHGYAIMQEVEAQTEGAMHLGPGTLYGSIQRMGKDGLIVQVEDHAASTPGEERRRYYRLTGFGQRVMVAEAHRLEHLMRLAQRKRIVPELGGAS